MIAPLLAQVESESEGLGLGGILLGVLILGLLAWLGARIISAGRGPKDGR